VKKWTVPLLVTLLTACQQSPWLTSDGLQGAKNTDIAGISFIEQVKATPGKTVIPYQKYVLDNGLTLILHQDHSDPLVHVDMTYHVGSGREQIGKSGFAHFFEHMMFQGSEHVADEQHFKLVSEAGGSMNGSTNSDRTNYYQTVPANQLEKMLWLEADRMGFLVESVTQEKFEVQRETVKNERGQRVDNRPYGRLNERVAQAMYPADHPYAWPVIGYMEDLNRVDVNDLKDFFLTWYGPNNATLSIGGDIDVKQTLALVNKYFATIPRGPEVKMPQKTALVLPQDRYISMQDNVHLPLIYMSYPTVSVKHADEAPLDLLSSILGDGKTSLFYKNLVKNQLAVQASTSHPCAELACTFNLLALPNPAAGKTLADLEKVIRDTLVEFEHRGVKDDDLSKAKAQMEAGFVFGLQSVAGKVSQLASNQTFTQNPNDIAQDIKRYANVSKADVMRVYRQYIKGKHGVIMSIVPNKNQANGEPYALAHQDNYTVLPRDLSRANISASSNIKKRNVIDTFDRAQIPVAGVNKPVKMPVMWQQTLDNGIKILGNQSLETPTTSLLLKIAAGHYFEHKDKAGTASILASMLNESTQVRSAEDMSKALQKLGSSVSISAANQYVLVNINSLTKHFDATMTLVKEKLMQPALLEAEFERVKNNALQGVINNKKNAGYLASTAYRQLLHSDNIAATPRAGSQSSLANISLGDIKAFYQIHFKPRNSQLILVSDLPQKQLISSLSVLNLWQGKGPVLDIELPVPETKTGVIYLVNKDNAAQSAILIGKRALKQDITGDFYKSYLMNFPLGEGFNSRINLNLREDKGYTYGARAYFSGDKYSGSFTASAEVRADVTDKSIVEFVKEIKRYAKEGITQEELNFMRKAVNQKDALKYETPHAKLLFLAQIIEHDLTPDFVRQRAEIADNISAAEINALAKAQLKLNKMLMVVVGNASVLKPELEALGYQVVDYKI
jgi:zinc protease